MALLRYVFTDPDYAEIHHPGNAVDLHDDPAILGFFIRHAPAILDKYGKDREARVNPEDLVLSKWLEWTPQWSRF